MSAAANSATPTNSLTRRDSAPDATSDLHHHGQHERPEPGTLAEEPLEVHSNLLLDQPRIGTLFHARAVDGRPHQARDFAQQRLRPRVEPEAPRDDVGLLDGARLPGDRHDGHHEPVAREMAAIAEDLVADLAAPRSVDQNPARRHLVGDAGAFAVDTDDVAVLGQYHLRARRDGLRDPGVARELAVLPMYRHEELRPDQRKHELELFRAAVPRDMDVLDALVDDVAPALRDVVHHPPDRLLVPRDLPRREHDHVVFADLRVAV